MPTYTPIRPVDPETQRIIDWVRAEIKSQKGKTQSGLADHLGLAHSQVTNLLKGKRGLQAFEVRKIAEYLGSTPPSRQYPLLGDVGAGGQVVETGWQGFTQEHIPGPEDLPEGTVALKVKGSSLGPGFNGWHVFYNDRREGFDDDWMKSLCVVGTADGRILVKWVYRGEEGLFNLVSGTGEIEEGVSLEWAAKVLDLRQPS